CTLMRWVCSAPPNEWLSCLVFLCCSYFFSIRRRHTRCLSDWSSDVCSSDLPAIDAWYRVALAGEQWLELAEAATRKIGRASCRERVEISGVAVLLKKKK